MTRVTLRRQDIADLYRALQSLDGRPELLSDGDGKPLGMRVKPFDFEPAARYAFAKTLRKLKGVISDYESAQNEIASRYRLMGSTNGKSREEVEHDLRLRDAEAREEIRKLMLVDDTVDLHFVAKADIKFDTNKLAPQTIAHLMLMIKEEHEERIAEENELAKASEAAVKEEKAEEDVEKVL